MDRRHAIVRAGRIYRVLDYRIRYAAGHHRPEVAWAQARSKTVTHRPRNFHTMNSTIRRAFCPKGADRLQIIFKRCRWKHSDVVETKSTHAGVERAKGAFVAAARANFTGRWWPMGEAYRQWAWRKGMGPLSKVHDATADATLQGTFMLS